MVLSYCDRATIPLVGKSPTKNFTNPNKGGLNMLEEITREEELNERRKYFTQLKRGSLFKFCDRSQERQRLFITVEKYDQEVKAIELTEDNRLKLVAGQSCDATRLHIDEMWALELL